MKTYSSKKKEQKNKKIYWILILASVVVIALTVTLIALSGGSKSPVIDSVTPEPDQGVVAPVPDEDEPVVTPEPDENVNVPVVTAPKFTAPVENGSVIRECTLTSLVYMPSLNMWKTHNGMDFSASENAPVLCVTDGKVTAVENTTLEGVVVTVEHANGLVSVYKSLASSTVKVGDSVSTGSEIGKAGTMLTETSDGIHVHLEMLEGGELIDPAKYVGGEILK